MSGFLHLHQHTLAASRLCIIVPDLKLADLAIVVGRATVGRIPLHLPIVLSDFTDRIVESLLDIHGSLG
jgi:hypothetical protein